MRYRAFISYSHADKDWAVWLQRNLERYHVPKLLRTTDTPKGRLLPIFRDRENLAVSESLGESIQLAISQSDTLIVLCSPDAAASRWVNDEIRLFRQLNPQRRILCLLVRGETDLSHPDCAFPPAATEHDGVVIEPSAADVRTGGDLKTDALHKIVGGMLSVNPEALSRRAHKRKLRVMSAAIAATATVAIVTTLLAINAYLADKESEVRRTQAEALIDFMLVELRSQLEPIGKLDVLDAVGDQALEYFRALDNLGSENEMRARAMAIRQIGEVRLSQGKLAEALAAFQESQKIMRALYERRTGNSDNLFELGQAEFWVGYAALLEGDLGTAESAFLIYNDISAQLGASDPDNQSYLQERIYAMSNLGTVSRELQRRDRALGYFQQAVELNEDLLAASPNDTYLHYDLAEGLSWLGSIQMELGMYRSAQATFARAFVLFGELHESESNSRYSQGYADMCTVLADTHITLGELDDARLVIRRCIDVYEQLTSLDGTNVTWQKGALITSRIDADILYLTGDFAAARNTIGEVAAKLAVLAAADPLLSSVKQQAAHAEMLIGMIDATAGNLGDAERHLRRASDITQSLLPSTLPSLVLLDVQILLWRGRIRSRNGSRLEATQLWSQALTRTESDQHNLKLQSLRRQLLAYLGEKQKAAAIGSLLSEKGFQDPRYL